MQLYAAGSIADCKGVESLVAEAVRVLLESGASTWVTDRKGRTPDQDTDVVEIREAIRAVRNGTDPLIACNLPKP